MPVATLPTRPLRKGWAPFVTALAAVALFSVMDAAVKRATLEAGLFMALLCRALVSTAVALPLWWRLEGRIPPRATLRLHALRGLVSVGTTIAFFWGLARTPLAEGIALSFIAPLVALWFAAALLGEAVRWPAIAAGVVGFAGVAVIALGQTHGGGGGEATLGIAAILVGAVLYALSLVLLRKQSQAAGPAEVALVQALAMVLAAAPLAPWWWHTPGLIAFGWMSFSGLLSSVALMLAAWAWGRAEAQVLVVTEYTAFIWAAGLGWWLFGEGLASSTLAGVMLILAGCWIGARHGSSVPAEPIAS